MSLSLAELIALVQDQVQKSFEYGEHMTTIGRDCDQSDLRINLSEAEVELPIEFQLEEVGVSSDHLKNLVTNGNSIDIANQLLNMPSLNKEFEFALKDRLTIDKINKVNLQQEETLEKKANEKVLEKNGEKEFTLPEMLSEIHTERIKKLQWGELENRKFALLKVANLTPNEASSEKENKFTGRISLKFKTVIK